MVEDIEIWKVAYNRAQDTYQRLCEAHAVAQEAADELKAMCDDAMRNMQSAGEDLLEAMRNSQ